MRDLIDVYVKLLIAVITLLVPLLIFYINLASNAKKNKLEEYDKKIKELQDGNKLDNVDPTVFEVRVKDIHDEIEILKAQKQSDLKLLNPVVQLKNIYATLLASFSLIIIDIAIRNGVIFPYNQIASGIIIGLSLALFLYTAILIRRVALVAIKTKEDLEKDLNK
jgi:hypothetical protein